MTGIWPQSKRFYDLEKLLLQRGDWLEDPGADDRNIKILFILAINQLDVQNFVLQ
jgi:hypothetical protein